MIKMTHCNFYSFIPYQLALGVYQSLLVLIVFRGLSSLKFDTLFSEVLGLLSKFYHVSFTNPGVKKNWAIFQLLSKTGSLLSSKRGREIRLKYCGI